MSISPRFGIHVREGDDLQSRVVGIEHGAAQSLSLRAYVSSSRAILLVMSLVIFAMFSQTVIVPYAFSDDYPLLAIATGLGPNPWFGSDIVDTVAALGRPLAGLLDRLFYESAGTIDNLRYVRLGVNALGACALGNQIRSRRFDRSVRVQHARLSGVRVVGRTL
jgi:hypothetical protein